MPRPHDAHPAREERREAPLREEVDIGGECLPGGTVDAVRHGIGQPVDDGEPRVHLDREATVRRRDEHAATDPESLRDELPLTRSPTEMLDHGVREDDVERPVREGKRTASPRT